MALPEPRRRGPARRALVMAVLALGVFGRAGAAEFTEEIDRDFPLRSIGQLQVTNLRGAIVIEGWAQDKIRLKAKRVATAQSLEEAHHLFQAADFRYRSIEGGRIELSAEYGRGLSLEERLRERNDPRTRMDIHVLAPASLALKVWAVAGQVSVKGWSSDLEVRTSSGPIQVEGWHAKNALILCDSCAIRLHSLRGSLHCNGGSGDVSLSEISGGTIYTEVTSGHLDARDISGEQLYVSRSGAISASELRGRVEFHAKEAGVDIKGLEGFLSGKTESGDITADVRTWKFLDKALVESRNGSVHLTLPRDFSGELDLSTVSGKVKSGFIISDLSQKEGTPADPNKRLHGRVSEGGETFRISTDRGNITVSPQD